MITFSDRLDYLIKENNHTPQTLIEKLELNHVGIVYSWLNQGVIPKIDNVIKLSNLFQCSIEYLLGRSENNDFLPAKQVPPLDEAINKALTKKNLSKFSLKKNKIVSSGLLYSIFNLKYTSYTENIIKIADYLKISIDELVGRV